MEPPRKAKIGGKPEWKEVETSCTDKKQGSSIDEKDVEERKDNTVKKIGKK